jgi:phytanoyl-CoA hydroxylase
MIDRIRALEEYERDGFTIFRNAIDSGLLAEARGHIEWLTRKYPELRPEHFHHPLMRDDAFWVRLVTDDNLLDIAELFLGPNLACFTAHYICKPPRDGQAVLWHQDGAYWKLEPMAGVTLWLAVDESTPENGCLRMLPGTHKLPLKPIEVRSDTPNMLYSSIDSNVLQELNTSRAVDIVLRPGDVSVHHPQIVHGSEPNKSSKRRCGLDMGFISTSTRISNRGLYLNPILVRGEPVEGINQYRAWPQFTPENSMRFRGCERWNEIVRERNRQGVYLDAAQPSVLDLTNHMIERLKEATTKE